MRKFGFALASLLALSAAEANATAVTAVANPGQPSVVGARIRWGGTGFEASILDFTSGTLVQSPVLNLQGAPFWASRLNQAFDFRITFDNIGGTIALMLDLDQDGDFDGGQFQESISLTLPILIDESFGFVQLSGNESGSTARSRVDLVNLEGEELGSLVPDGQLINSFYSLTPPDGNILLTGEITFETLGTAQERPSYSFTFSRPLATEVPAPASLSLVAGGLLLAGAFARRRRA